MLAGAAAGMSRIASTYRQRELARVTNDPSPMSAAKKSAARLSLNEDVLDTEAVAACALPRVAEGDEAGADGKARLVRTVSQTSASVVVAP